jgi:hypothetical protein
MVLRESQVAALAATRAACELVKAIRGRGLSKMLNQLTPSTKAWIVEHDAIDARAKENAAREKARAKARTAALKKLTPADREVLGLK